MLAVDRRHRILQEVAEKQTIHIAELAVELDVSEMTVRRDITRLEREGFLRRTYGGATAHITRSMELLFNARALRTRRQAAHRHACRRSARADCARCSSASGAPPSSSRCSSRRATTSRSSRVGDRGQLPGRPTRPRRPARRRRAHRRAGLRRADRRGHHPAVSRRGRRPGRRGRQRRHGITELDDEPPRSAG